MTFLHLGVIRLNDVSKTSCRRTTVRRACIAVFRTYMVFCFIEGKKKNICTKAIKLIGKGYKLERFKSIQQYVWRRLFNKPSPKLFSHVGGRSCSNAQASLLMYIQAQVVLNSGAISRREKQSVWC